MGGDRAPTARGSPPGARLASPGAGWLNTRLSDPVRSVQDHIMSRVCQVTGKKPMVGNTVSHANNKRRRRFLPNLHTQRFWLEDERRWVTLRVSTRGLRTLEKHGVAKVIADLRARGERV